MVDPASNLPDLSSAAGPQRRLAPSTVVIPLLVLTLVGGLVAVLWSNRGTGVLDSPVSARDVFVSRTLEENLVRRNLLGEANAERLIELVNSAKVVDRWDTGGTVQSFLNQFRKPMVLPSWSSSRLFELSDETGQSYQFSISNDGSELVGYRRPSSISAATMKPSAISLVIIVDVGEAAADEIRRIIDAGTAEAESVDE